MSQIKFGTDGWRAIIGEDYTIDNLKRVAAATALWVNKKAELQKRVVIGYDCRFGGKMFSEVSAQVLAHYGIEVILSPGFASTPMVSLAAKKLNCGCGVVITASHNPPSYNGFKIKGSYGGPALPDMIDEVEALIPEQFTERLEPLESLISAGRIRYEDLETMYVNQAESVFDMAAIRASRFRIGYDAMYGAGQNAVRRLLPEATLMHCEFNPGFNGTAPEPILKNLREFSDMIRSSGTIDIGFATDGDADRIGLLDSKGNFVDSHHIILMLINYLHTFKGLNGKIVNSFSCTSKIGDLCRQLGLENIITKIGFKYICGYMVTDDVLVGGEESGGIAVSTHIPERDGIWIALTLIEYMAKTGKSLESLIDEVYAAVGTFAMDRIDWHLDNSLKEEIMSHCQSGAYKTMAGEDIVRTETVDGYKFWLSSGSWIMIRASGTEPVLRIYCEAPDQATATRLLESAKAELESEELMWS